MLDSLVRQHFGHEPTSGDVGLEIEVEGRNLPNRGITGWRVELDSSLKAQEAYEYVSRNPVKASSVKAHLRVLNTALKELESEVDDSYRAGVHCHINVQELTMRQLANFVTLAVCFESVLADSCGDERKGNLFALRVRDAEYVVEEWINCFQEGRFVSLNAIKYSFMNLASAPRFGSLEFRGMRSTTDPKVLMPYIEDLMSLRNAAVEFQNPQDIIEQFSIHGVREFSREVFGRNVVTRMAQESVVREDMRFAQDFAFSRGW